MTQPVLNQQSYRGRLDDNNEVDATWVTAADTAWSQQVATNFRVRFLIQETAGGMAQNTTLKLQESLDNGTWAQVSAQSANIVLASSQNYAALSDTTQQIGAGSFITPNAGMAHSSSVSAVGGDPVDFQSNEVEIEWCLQIVSADVAHLGDIQLRILDGDVVLDNYTVGATANFVSLRPTQDVENSILTDVDILFHGLVEESGGDQDIQGTALIDADILNHGLITYDIAGSILTDADTLNHGLITYDIAGSILDDSADNLDGFQGAVDVGVVDIAASILTDADTLFHGEFFFGAVDIEGSILTDADTLNHGLITHIIEGSILIDADSLFHGDIGVGAVNIDSSLLTDADTLNHGSLTINIEGSVLENVIIDGNG